MRSVHIGEPSNSSTSATSRAQPTASADPFVQQCTEEQQARKIYKEKVASANKARDAKAKPAVDGAVKEAKAQGKDPMMARRDAKEKALEATKAEYTANVKATAQERDASLAAARKKAAAKP